NRLRSPMQSGGRRSGRAAAAGRGGQRSASPGKGSFSIDPPGVLRILRVLSAGSARPSQRETLRRNVHRIVAPHDVPTDGRVRAPGRSGLARGNMKRKKGSGDEEFDVFGEDVEEIEDDELEDDEEFDEDDLDEDEFDEDDDDFEDDFVEDDELQVN